MEISLNKNIKINKGCIYLTSTCWDENYQPLTIDMTKDEYTGQYRLRLYCLFIPDNFLFQINSISIYPNVNQEGLINLSKPAEQQKNQRANKTKNRILKQTHDKKFVENLSPIAKKLDILNRTTGKIR